MKLFKFFISLFKRKRTKVLTPRLIDKWQAYAEDIILNETKLYPENVLVHDYGKFGLAGKTWTTHTTYTRKSTGDEYKFDIPLPEVAYIIVPEIRDWWTFRAWLHEIGHNVLGHHTRAKSSLPTYMLEYEAEIYCLGKAQLCPSLDDYRYKLMTWSAMAYLLSHVEDEAEEGKLRGIYQLPKKVRDFLTQDTDYYTDKFIKDSIEVAYMKGENQRFREQLEKYQRGKARQNYEKSRRYYDN